ncbi:phthiocerol/phthiodiolone dimycocerosyl transferase family protein [Nocardia sp. CA-128927]|uniref:phthiocerol/phthiodiolone dimycocerosyl transferase family protein n=1 Tax=Nocardia sp. CA-128927 TaxID=3239975 RepID=UPI003D97E0E7
MTSSQLLVRPLAPSEVTHFRFGLYVGYAARVRGKLDSAALAQAFAILREAYPILSARLVLDHVSQPSIEAAPELSAAVDEVTGPTDEPLFGLPDLADRAAAIHTVRGSDDTATVTLLTHHAIADGHHSLHLLSELWHLYTACVADELTAPHRHDYPHSLEHLLDQRGIDVGPTVLPDENVLGALADVDIPSTPPERVRTRLSAADTAALLAAGRSQGTTINGLVSAALLAATAQSRGVDIATLHYTYPVDLRSRLTPRVGYPEGTNVLGMAYFTADSHADDDLLALARAITGNLREGVATGAVFAGSSQFMAAATAQGDSINPAEFLSTMVISTNWGVIPHLPTPPDLTIEDFYPVMPSNPMTAVAPYVITTYDGQLTIDTSARSAETSQLLADQLHSLARAF